MKGEIGGVLILGLLVMTGCASNRTVTSGRAAVDYNSYNEDLASVRPVYRPMPVASGNTTAPTTSTTSAPAARKPESRKPAAPIEAMHINRRLDMVLDTIATQNRSIRYAPGFRIQVYVGTQRQEVDAIRQLITQNFPELNPYLSYNQPTYRLKIGDFMRRMDAERYYSLVKRMIESAQLQADKVDIRRSLSIK
ncbi:sporulation protein [Spirosoma linguale]|uniref:Sporulation domain protein n=1 Tax=Spirosoma linguale (strain ATCC 33905 / DSM 74 / LMG 10896 / Claus 1) TaxID=504472 RepID=D2QGV4_SPILD|nr:Sporulation domain protein [Spirosoma linguale DSM 74]